MSARMSTYGVPDGVIPVGRCNKRDALRVLRRGFPRDDAFWERGFVRWNTLSGVSNGHEHVDGHVFRASGQDVGVLLTFRSDRPGPEGTTRTMVNLSSWYVDDAYRWKAPMMLRSFIRDSGAVFTDLTPSPEVDRINVALGFQDWSDGMLVAAAAPWAAMRSPEAVRLVDLDGAQARLLDDAEHEMLARHRAVGCLPAIMVQPHGVAALLFRLIRRKGVVLAQLLYAESRQKVIRHLPAVMRFLLMRGVFLLSIDAVRSQCPPGTFFRPGQRRFFKGPIERDRLDYACSELVIFDL